MIKNAFNKQFRFLKIEFFNAAHKVNEPSRSASLVKGNVELEKINPLIQEGLLTITHRQTVAEVEQSFQQYFGIPVQIFRKQGDVWIETTRTDHLTLMEQNEMGRNASEPIVNEKTGDRYLEDGQY